MPDEERPLDRPPVRRGVLLLVPTLLALHNLEEALTFERYLPVVRARVPAAVQPIVASISYRQMLVALTIATVVPFAVACWALVRPRSAVALWSAMLVQAVVLLNVLSHVASAATLFRGYGPGLATAVAINLPFSIHLLRRATRERWLSRRALSLLLPAALFVHGPLLIGAIALGASVPPGR